MATKINNLGTLDIPEEVTATGGAFRKVRDVLGIPLILHTAVYVVSDKPEYPDQYRCVAQEIGKPDSEQFTLYTSHAQPMRVIAFLKDSDQLPVACRFVQVGKAYTLEGVSEATLAKALPGSDEVPF